MLIVIATGCGEANGGGAGGTGGSSLTAERSYRHECKIDTLTLEIPIEARFELDRPFSVGSDTELTFSEMVTFDEPAVAALTGAGVDTIDIISMDLHAWVTAALPASVADAPINDFDLAVDMYEIGVAGPHRLELNAVNTVTTITEGADQVKLGRGLQQLSPLLGDFLVPSDCLGPTLGGLSGGFPVELLE
jgi:hypothetical protein